MIPETHFQGVLDIWQERCEVSVCPIEGNCMSPVIREGDTLVIKHGPQDIHVGDVVVFGSPGSFLVHRVLKISGGEGNETFILKADRNPTFHQPVSRDEILGRVVEVRGSNGRMCLNSPFWRSLNYMLSIRSYISARRIGAGSVFWRTVNYLFVLWSRIIPDRYSVSRTLWRGVCRVQKTWNAMRTFETAGKTGE